MIKRNHPLKPLRLGVAQFDAVAGVWRRTWIAALMVIDSTAVIACQ